LSLLGGLTEHAKQVKFASRLAQVCRDRLSQQLSKLFRYGVSEGVPIILAFKRAVTKNETTCTPGGGCSTNHDISADLPAQAGPRHHIYVP
jgi:hypothetical protein